MRTTNTEATEPEDPEPACLAYYEDLYEEYCEGLLYQHLNSFPAIDIYALPASEYGPLPKRRG